MQESFKIFTNFPTSQFSARFVQEYEPLGIDIGFAIVLWQLAHCFMLALRLNFSITQHRWKLTMVDVQQPLTLIRPL